VNVIQQGLAEELRDQVDVTTFKSVRHYLLDASSDIKLVIVVNAGYDLADVAACLCETPNHRVIDRDSFEEVVFTKKISVVAPTGPHQKKHEEQTIPLDTIPLDLECKVICLPTVYVVQFVA